jgi:WD40 repeat protein
MNKMLWAFVVCFLSIGKIYSAADIEPIKIGHTQKPVASLAELEEAIPATDVQHVIMGYLNSWEYHVKFIKEHKTKLMKLTYFQNGNYIASTSADSHIKWGPQGNGLPACEITFQRPKDLSPALAISVDGEIVALKECSYKEDCIKIIDLKNNKCEVRQELKVHNDKITSLAFSPDSKYIVSGSSDKRIVIWHMQNNKYQLLQTLIEDSQVSAVMFFAQSENIISGYWNGVIKIWQYNHKNHKFEYKQNLPKRKLQMVDNITSSFDKTRLAFNSRMYIELWCYQDNQWVYTQNIECNNNENDFDSLSISFSLDNNYFAVGQGNKITIYKLDQNKQYKCVQTINLSLNNRVINILFSPNMSLIYGLSDGSIKIIKNQALELYARAKAEKSPK